MTNHSKTVRYLQLCLGSILFPAAVIFFIEPEGLNTGGLVGFSQILSWLCLHSFRLTGLINFCINIPLFILSCRSISKGFFKKTLLSLIIQSLLMSFLPRISKPVLDDVLSNLIFGAVIGGIGIGLCLQSGGSAGGLDILGVYFSKKGSGISVGKISYLVNAVVLTMSILVFSLRSTLYSVVFIVLMYFVADRVHYQNISVYIIIITTNPDLKKIITEETHRGITWWNGIGAYSNTQKEVLLCITDRYEVQSIRKIVKENDPKAFLLLCKGTPLLGNYEKHLTL